MKIPQPLAVGLVPALVVAVWLNHWFAVERDDLSTWSGAGYGMFATYDNEDTRFVLGKYFDGDGAHTATPPPALADLAFAARVLPTDERVRALAEAWLRLLPEDTRGLSVTVVGPRLSGDDLGGRGVGWATVRAEVQRR